MVKRLVLWTSGTRNLCLLSSMARIKLKGHEAFGPGEAGVEGGGDVTTASFVLAEWCVIRYDAGEEESTSKNEIEVRSTLVRARTIFLRWND